MISRTRRGVLVTVATVAGLLFAAPQALAGTVSFNVPEYPGYSTVERNNTQDVAANYEGCLTTRVVDFTLFEVRSTVQTTTQATFYVFAAEGQKPLATLQPTNPITLQAGAEQTQRVRLLFTLANPSSRPTTFRVGLRTESGETLGDPVGLVLTVPCVIEAQQRFPAATSRAARAPARCLGVVANRRPRAGQLVELTIAVQSQAGVPVLGSRFRITAAGARPRLAYTLQEGVRQLRVRPRRAGELIVQSDVCTGSVRIPVAAARNTQGRGSPRFTG